MPIKILIKEHNFGDTVYLRTDSEQLPWEIDHVTATPLGIIYGLFRNGDMKDAYFIKQLGQKLYYDIYYTFLIEFKEGKMRVSFTPEQIMADGRKALFTYKTFFKEDGSVRPAYKDAPPSLNENVNGLVRSLLDSFIEKKSDW